MLSHPYILSSSGIWTKNEKSDFNYSDGEEVENRLSKQIQAARDVSLASDELQQLVIDWPSEYHYSSLRSNLLSSFKLDQFRDILEIGSGCGAITRFLGEHCPASNIIALEGSLQRAVITRARCRDLSNVVVCNDSFSEFVHKKPFDFIAMIGALEYSPSYIDGDDPMLRALGIARALLQDNGILAIAIENQLGLKYFNGCMEDHTGEAFLGINDLYVPGTVNTLGKKQLERKIKKAGFQRVDFIYPFPDYKLPKLLLRDESFNSKACDIAHIVGQFQARDYDGQGEKIFWEDRAWRLLHRNGFLREMANSFLVFAFAGPHTLDEITEPWIVKTFSGRRKKKYLTETVFYKENDQVIVEKIPCYTDDKTQKDDPSTMMVHHIGKVGYIAGLPYRHFLPQKVLKQDTLDKFFLYLKPWIDWAGEQTFLHSGDDDEQKAMIPGSLYDCIPVNFIVDKHDRLNHIDQEWEYKGPLDFGFIVFRGIFSELSDHMDFFEQTDLFEQSTILDVYTKIYEKLGLHFDWGVLSDYLDLEISVQMELVAVRTDSDGLKKLFEKFFTEKRIPKSSLSELLRAGGSRHLSLPEEQIRTLEQSLAEQEEKISTLNSIVEDRDRLLSTMMQSKSWRLTSPLRRVAALVHRNLGKLSL